MKYEVDIVVVKNGKCEMSFYGVYANQEKANAVASNLASMGLNTHVSVKHSFYEKEMMRLNSENA